VATITIPDLDDRVVDKIKDLAEEHNHSVESEIKDILQQAAEALVHDRSLVEIADAIAALTPKDLPQTDSAILLREDRAR
jgi:antitoxin FitA